MAQYVCVLCEWIYDEETGDPKRGIAPGTRFEDLPDVGNAPNASPAKTNSNCWNSPPEPPVSAPKRPSENMNDSMNDYTSDDYPEYEENSSAANLPLPPHSVEAEQSVLGGLLLETARGTESPTWWREKTFIVMNTA